MKKKSTFKEEVEAKLSQYLRKKTRDTDHPFISTRNMFADIKLDYNNMKHYRHVMEVIHAWRRQAPFFYQSMKEEGKLNGHDYYNSFSSFLVDFNSIGGFYLWHTTRDVDGTIVYGFYQPTAIQKQTVDNERSLLVVKQLKNKLWQIQTFGQQLPSGVDPEKALLSISRYEQRYLLPKSKD